MGFYDSFKQGLFSELNPDAYKLAQQNAFLKQQAVDSSAAYAKAVDPLIQQYGLNTPEFYAHLPDAAYRAGDDNMFSKIGQSYGLANQDAVLKPQANLMLTSDLKEYVAVTGDAGLQDRAGINAYLQAANASKATRVSVNNAAPITPAGYVDMEDISKGHVIDRDTGLPPTDLNKENFYNNIKIGKYKVLPEGAAEGIRDAGKALTILDQAQTGLNEVLASQKAGDSVETKLGNYGTNLYNSITKNDGGAIASYQGLVAGTISPIVKTLGSKGSLSDSDMKRADMLIANIGKLDPSDNASAKSAKRMFDQLRNIIKTNRAIDGGVPIDEQISYEPIKNPDGSIATRRVMVKNGKKFVDFDTDYSEY